MELSDTGSCESNCDDDDSAEGRVARSLFRTEWDDTSSGSEHARDGRLAPATGAYGLEDAAVGRAKRVRQIMHVQVESKSAAASIAEMLWPAASYLAEFLLRRGSVLATEPLQTEDLPVEAPRKNCPSPSPIRPNNQHQSEKRVVLSTLDKLLRIPKLPIVELGAGVGLTGLELATQLPCHILLTDLPVGLDLLRRNVNLNREIFLVGGDNSAHVQKLEWGNDADALGAIQWCVEQAPSLPILIIGSDCVYWEELHEPLESTIFSLLSEAPRGSLCVLAGMRRWKRDTSFYQALGKRSRTATHELRCTCVQETISRSDAGQREVMRVFVVRLVAR